MAPINLPDGTEVSEVILPDGATASEVLAPDGSTVFDAIPDTQIHYHNPDNFTTSNWPDEVGDSDIATISGLSFDSSAFGDNGGVVAEASNDDYGLSDTMGNFGQNRDTDWAVSIPFNTTDTSGMFISHDESGTAARTLEIGIGVSFHGASSGEIGVRLRDSDGNELAENSDGSAFNDGNDHHLIINKVGNSAGGIELYVDDMANETGHATETDSGFGNASVQNFDGAVGYFAFSQSGSIQGIHLSATMGRIRWFSDSLTQSDRESVHDDLPWT